MRFYQQYDLMCMVQPDVPLEPVLGYDILMYVPSVCLMMRYARLLRTDEGSYPTLQRPRSSLQHVSVTRTVTMTVTYGRDLDQNRDGTVSMIVTCER